MREGGERGVGEGGKERGEEHLGNPIHSSLVQPLGRILPCFLGRRHLIVEGGREDGGGMWEET